MADNVPSGPEFRTARFNSTSSTASTTTSTSAASSPPPRRSSNLFEGLENQKRRSDPDSIARRQSMNEQRIAPGFLGKMWNEYVRGK
ncbi:hypothetical protein QBC43DRAFT_2039 [Cladorrhinum sp. PSN259]|nr:hypothetical protein QBC43DRAFT_2039 [Cladorrhinum sp. PSN259]